MGYLETLRVDFLATTAEFLGTFSFLTFAFGGVQAAKAANAAYATNQAVTALTVEEVQFVATAFGLALLVAAWSFFRVSGSVFNPAVSFALWLVGVLSFHRFVFYLIAEIAGGIAASAVVYAIVPGPLKVTNSLTPGVTNAQGVILEMLGTAALVTTVLFLAAEKSRATPFAPVGVGLSLFSIHLFLVGFTGCGVNPARSFGPAVIAGFETSQWIYWVGPIAGSCVSSLLYVILKHFKYENLTPGQDSTDPEDSPSHPIKSRKTMRAIIPGLRRGHHDSNETMTPDVEAGGPEPNYAPPPQPKVQ